MGDRRLGNWKPFLLFFFLRLRKSNVLVWMCWVICRVKQNWFWWYSISSRWVRQNCHRSLFDMLSNSCGYSTVQSWQEACKNMLQVIASKAQLVVSPRVITPSCQYPPAHSNMTLACCGSLRDKQNLSADRYRLGCISPVSRIQQEKLPIASRYKEEPLTLLCPSTSHPPKEGSYQQKPSEELRPPSTKSP